MQHTLDRFHHIMTTKEVKKLPAWFEIHLSKTEMEYIFGKHFLKESLSSSADFCYEFYFSDERFCYCLDYERRGYELFVLHSFYSSDLSSFYQKMTYSHFVFPQHELEEANRKKEILTNVLQHPTFGQYPSKPIKLTKPKSTKS